MSHGAVENFRVGRHPGCIPVSQLVVANPASTDGAGTLRTSCPGKRKGYHGRARGKHQRAAE